MDWRDLLEALLLIACYRVVLWAFGYEIKEKLKYRFKCSLCEFSAGANDQEILTRIRATHTHHIIKAPPG